MNSRQVQYAIELSKHLNFSQVAERLGISQPALSKQILSLENELGIKLFDRNSVPLTLTPAGEYFIREARDLLYREEQLMRSMENFRSGKFGKLVIGISPFRSLYLLPPVVSKVKEKYPGIQIILHEITSDVLRRESAEGKYDFAIANLPVDESVLDVTPIEPDTLALVVPRMMVSRILHFTSEIPARVEIKDCKDLPFIVVGQSQEMRQLFDKMCATADIRPNVAMEVVGLTTAWAMSRAGVGATLLPFQFVKNMGIDDSISVFVLKDNLRTRQPAIITKRGQYLTEYAKYAIELIKKGL